MTKRMVSSALLLVVFSLVGRGAENVLEPPSPEWTRDLIIYEIATKAFTSPNGPETGTFNSLKAKLPYLQELGITGIWLTGHSLADPHHFYNIWTQYAVIEPDKLDPSLGTEEEFKALIAEAHRRGIKVFLDVITHGVMSNSPLIIKHPRWFRGGTWGMTDYDWFGGHTDLDDWWVRMWTNYVTEYGVDGYRLDGDICRPDLWERIRQNATAAGHPIVIFEELNSAIPGVTDFSQSRTRLSNTRTGALHKVLANDVPGFYDRKFGKTGHYQVEIRYDDGSMAEGGTSGQGTLRVRFTGLTADKVSGRMEDDQPDGIPDVQLTVGNVSASNPIDDIVVTDDMGGRWDLRWAKHRLLLALEGKPPTLQIYLATRAHGWPSLQLSCHDNGWKVYPPDKNPYAAKGSRATFGYSFLFTPMIPIFMSGEEFNTTFRPIPWLAPNLYGGKDAGKGRWLYGAMLDWKELAKPGHRAMLEDVKKMIAIRKQEADVLGPLTPDHDSPKLIRVPFKSDIAVPVPYVRWSGDKAIVVAANRNPEDDANLELRIPLAKMGLAVSSSYKVTDLWTGATKNYTARELKTFTFKVARDKSPGGGIRIFKIEAIKKAP